jgi:hypothetical protein
LASSRSPTSRAGAGQKIIEGPVKSLATSMRVPVLQPAKLARDQFESQFASLNADIGVVAAYGKILPDWLLAAPRFGLINVHASLLPRYRGASPVHRAVINGDSETGVTIMRVVKALDAGPMLASAIVPIGATTRRRSSSRCWQFAVPSCSFRRWMRSRPVRRARRRRTNRWSRMRPSWQRPKDSSTGRFPAPGFTT